MSTFKQHQHQKRVTSIPTVPTFSFLQPSRSLASQSTPASEQAHPVTQAQLDNAARFGHSFARISLFPPDRLPMDARSTGIQRKVRIPDSSVETLPQKEEDTAETIRQVAQAGAQTPSSPLPFVEQIRQSFGRFDISQIQAHWGSQAAASAAVMGASAYATGEHVVFAGRPDLHTAAHEAAHVVQQREGVQLTGGVGKVGDIYEQHADTVADRVTMGQSAEDLLDQFPGKQASKALFDEYAQTEIGQTKEKTSSANPLQIGRGSAYLVQRKAKIKPPERRTAIDLDLLTDHEIEQLINILKTGPTVKNSVINVKDFVINIDDETLEGLQERAEKKLRLRRQVTESFNVRGRAQDAGSGFVFSDDAGIRDIATENGLSAYPSDSANQVRAEYPNDFQGLTLLIDQPDRAKTKFYGKSTSQRGPRENAAAATGNEQILRPTNNPAKSWITLYGPCRRGNESKTQATAMGGISALNYAKAVGIMGADKHTWEWLHLIGSAIGGHNEYGNLVAGTYDMNTLMIPLEQTIVEYSNRNDVSPQNPMTVTAESDLWEDDKNQLTWIARSITLRVKHGKNEFWLGPIGLKTDILTKMEFDFYRYVFQRMAGNT